MQLVPAPVVAELLATGQRPDMILEVWIPGTGWVNICTLGGKDYLKDISFSLGGARMTPDPIAGDWSAVINNEGNVFHPDHPTSLWKTYFQAGRHVRIWLGGTYATGPKLWQRIIGRMDEPVYDESGFELTISGLDYMKVLSDVKFTKEVFGAGATPIDNYWGDVLVTDSVSTAGALGIEIYAENDAMDTGAVGVEAPNVANWAVHTNGATAFTWEVQIGGFSNWEGKFVANPAGILSLIENPNVGNITLGNEYLVTFKYRRTAGSHSLLVSIVQGAIVQGFVAGLNSDVWADGYFYFTALSSGVAAMRLRCKILDGGASTFRIDNISIKHVTSSTWHRYPMPAACTGIYYVELNEGSGFQAVWPGKQKGEGWYYDPDTQYFYFDEDKGVDAGDANLVIYYFIAYKPEDVLADIMVKAGIYNTRANALNPATGMIGAPWPRFTIPRVWFDAGSIYIDAIKKICERCNRRFYLSYDGRPAFVTPPMAVAPPTFSFTHPRHIASPKFYQDKNEIRNRIAIEGEKRAELVGWEDNMPSELKDEMSNPASMTLYGEHTLNIRNHLFQDQASISDMCGTLLTAYEWPKWYFDFNTPYNAVPLELGDTVRINVLLDRTLPPGTRHIYRRGLIRNMNISKYDVTFKCEKVED